MLKKSFWDNPHLKNQREILIITAELLVIIFCGYNLAFSGRVFPKIFVAGVNLGGINKKVAARYLEEKVALPQKAVFTFADQTIEINQESLNLTVNWQDSVEKAYFYSRTGNFFWDLKTRVQSLFKRTDLDLSINLDDEALKKTTAVVAGQVEVEPVLPQLKIKGDVVNVSSGQAGTLLDRELFKAMVGQVFAKGINSPQILPLRVIDPTLTKEEETIYKARGESLLGKKLTLTYQDQNLSLEKEKLLALIGPHGSYQEKEIEKVVVELASQINRKPQNSVFVFEKGRVKEFVPSLPGLTVDQNLLSQMLIGNLSGLENGSEKEIVIDIPVTVTEPEITTGEINNFGIKELIGKGVSYFAGSIPNRIHNINLASSKFTGVLVKPDAVFSFNEIVGDISKETGFKEAYIIKEGKTILGDGGGVCQVSSTLFRAALNAGLPIVERTAHAYRVGYYEQKSPPGFDATVFSPTTDLKIKNDTNHHLLIQASVDNAAKMLVFEIYGTYDGRIATVGKPQITEITPPPPDIYQDDPNLPSGKIVQTEHKAAGAKVSFNYRVEKDGAVIFQKIFVSNYKPWPAVYLRGTGPAKE